MSNSLPRRYGMYSTVHLIAVIEFLGIDIGIHVMHRLGLYGYKLSIRPFVGIRRNSHH